MPKKNASEYSTSYAEQYADETTDDRKQSNFALDHPPDDWRQTDFAHRFTDELKATNDSAAAPFMLLLTHSRLMPKRGRFRSLRGHDFRSVSDSTRWAGTRTSRPCFVLLPGTSGFRLRMGGSRLSRRSTGRRERHNPIRRPVPSITHMAIRTW